MESLRLLAKRIPEEAAAQEAATLAGHTREVFRAAETFLDSHEEHLESMFRLAPEQVAKLRRLLRISAVLHDLGKSNSQFQRLIQGERLRQAIRHEQISCWLAQEIMPLSEDLPQIDQRMIAHAVLGHHRQYPDDADRDGCGGEVDLYQYGDFEEIVSSLRLRERPKLPAKLKVSGPNGLSQVLRNQEIRALQEFHDWDSSKRLFLGILKNSLILADILGSTVGRETDVQAWSRTAWSNVCSEDEMASIAQRRLGGMPPRRFQIELGGATSRLTLAHAACGSGKTVGAYLWAKKHAVGRKLFFCYPTTGTATEGFRDYVQDADATLSHSRVAVDFEILGLKDKSGEVQDQLQIARAVCEWYPKIISCTADLVLGIIHNAYASICAWPSLVNGAFVFDEIHSYDEGLWTSLLKFIRTFHAPVLMMTASLPQSRRRELESLAHQENEPIEMISGPQELERYPRYRRRSDGSPEQIVRNQYSSGAHILWVANTVDRCLRASDLLSDLTPHVYHSRYRYRDRVQRHGEVIQAFRRDQAALAICTQVAEMSLDISADLLISDLAPVPSLIQRLGRLNRRASPNRPAPAAPFIIVHPDQPLPYDQAELDIASEWLLKLGFEELSQTSLSLAWKSEPAMRESIFNDEWLGGGVYTRPGPLREGSYTLSFILSADAASARSSINRLPEWIIPMIPPRYMDWQAWPRVGYARIAPAGCMIYDPSRGAEWAKTNLR